MSRLDLELSMTMKETSRLASFLADLHYEDLPPDVVELAKAGDSRRYRRGPVQHPPGVVADRRGLCSRYGGRRAVPRSGGDRGG